MCSKEQIKMKVIGVLFFALCAAFASCKKNDLRCIWDGWETVEHKNTCEALRVACGDSYKRLIKCKDAKKMVRGQISEEDWKEDVSCYLDLETRQSVDLTRCQRAFWACEPDGVSKMKTKYLYVHPGPCPGFSGNTTRDSDQCSDERKVCPWLNVKKVEKKGGFRGWFNKQKSKIKKIISKTKNALKKGLKLGKVCIYGGEEYANRCEFMKERCRTFAKSNGGIVLFPVARGRKCTGDMDSQNAEWLMNNEPKF